MGAHSKALFIGGTGTISTDITTLCAKNDWDITLLNRGNHNQRLPSGIKLSQWVLNISDESAVKARLEDEFFDVVVNFINFTEEQIERDIRLFSGKTRQYIFISSASAYQKPLSHHVVTESTPLSNPYWEYSRDKIACEERLMSEYRQKGFPVTIVRPSHTYDDYKVPVIVHGDKGSWATLNRMLEGKPVLICGDGTSLWPLTHSEDFAKGFIGLMGNIQAIGEAVHITTDEALCWNQIYMAIGHALGVEPKLAHVSTDFIVACDPSQAGPLLGDKVNTVVFDNSKIKRLSPGFKANIRFDQGIKRAVDYMLKTSEAQIPDPHFECFTDRIIDAQAAALEIIREKVER